MGITDRCVEKKEMSLNPELISRTALMEDFRNTITESSDTMDWLNMINRQSIAYDVDAVVEKLEELHTECENPLEEYSVDYFIDSAIKIVKAGGNR